MNTAEASTRFAPRCSTAAAVRRRGIGATPRRRALVQAVKAGDRATALALARDTAEVAAAEADGTTALHWAVRQNDLELVDRLLRTGADANAANRYGVTPLQPRRRQRRSRS